MNADCEIEDFFEDIEVCSFAKTGSLFTFLNFFLNLDGFFALKISPIKAIAEIILILKHYFFLIGMIAKIQLGHFFACLYLILEI